MTDLMSEDRRQLGLGLEEVQHTRGDVHGPAGDGEGVDRLRPDDVEAVRDRLAAGVLQQRPRHLRHVGLERRITFHQAARRDLALDFATDLDLALVGDARDYQADLVHVASEVGGQFQHGIETGLLLRLAAAEEDPPDGGERNERDEQQHAPPGRRSRASTYRLIPSRYLVYR